MRNEKDDKMRNEKGGMRKREYIQKLGDQISKRF